MSPMQIDDITPAEASAILNVENLERFMDGPFIAHDGKYHLRQVLGGAVMLQLEPIIGVQAAVRVAVTAAAEAQTEAPHRLLALGWARREPVAAWVSHIPTDVERPLVVLPPDLWLAQIRDELIAVRAAAATPH